MDVGCCRALALQAAAALAASLTLTACQSVFQQDADQAAYGIIQQRQRQALGAPSEVRLSPPPAPLNTGPEIYQKVPPTTNVVPPGYEPATQNLQPTPPTGVVAPGTAPATTQAAASQPSMSTSIDALVANLPGISLDVMPELPQFPRPAEEGKTRQTFTLDDCFNYALAHSRDYRSRKEDLYIEALRLTLARHQFEPRLFAQTFLGVTGEGEASDYAAALSVTQSLGVRQRLPFGGEIVAQALARSVGELRDSVSESGSAEGVLSANIPLLRGAGWVAQEDLIQAERRLIYEVREFERYRRGFLVQVASAYFDLVNRRAQIMNRFRSVNAYIFAARRTKALFDAGRPRVSILDVQRARQLEFSARNDLINAIESYELSVDNFKLLLGMDPGQDLDVAPQYLNITPPTTPEERAIAIAQVLRLDLQTARDRVEDARRNVKVASNNLLPDLNLSASAGVRSDPGRRNYAPQAENLDYAAGFVLNWPLDRLAERNTYRVSQINLDRAKRDVEQAEDRVEIDVRSALRRVRQQLFLVALQRNNIKLAQARKEFADIQFRNGKIDNRDYLEAETALLDAQNRFAQAISGLQIATLQFLRDTDQLRVDAGGRLLLPTAGPGAPATMPAGAAVPTTAPSTMPAGPSPNS